MRSGVEYGPEGLCTVRVWSPQAGRVRVYLYGAGERVCELERGERGYWEAELVGVRAGARYVVQVDEGPRRPDPASQWQPEGVHEPSAVVDHGVYAWGDGDWRGVSLEEMILYELHVGTFTAEGTFEAAIERLGALKELGVTAVELMPVAAFPGERNWGYDGVYPYAVQESYGGPAGLKRLVDAAHGMGLAVVLDVVYNHLGPEGNYLREFGPYFTDRHRTPWGEAMNFDGPWSDGVREYFIENALYWLKEYHIDALRLDALHAIVDLSAKNFMAELAERVEAFSAESGRKRYLIGESDLNDVRLIEGRERNGYGLDAQWSDGFHHSVHTLLTGERQGYYEDFGRAEHLAKALREGFVYTWEYSAYRKRYQGSGSGHLPSRQFVVCAQNHDQVGNRMLGERLAGLVDFEGLKVAAAAMLLSPYVPLLFMGEEYGEERPFQYFVSHGDRELVEAVRQGRRREFEAFAWEGECPDPQAKATFERSVLQWDLRSEGRHRVLLEWYRRLIEFRRAPGFVSKEGLEVRAWDEKGLVEWRREIEGRRWLCWLHFGSEATDVELEGAGTWARVLDSAGSEWAGPGSRLPERLKGGGRFELQARSVVLLQA